LAVSKVDVNGTAVAGAPPRVRRASPPPQAVRVGRRTLWKAAALMTIAHPLLGIGPDNFRLSYGPFAGLTDPDPRVTSNNMYLEVLAGTGPAGFAALVWLCWRVAGAIRAARGRMVDGARSIYDGVAAATVAIGIHGLLDSFLTLTPTYLAISIALGLAVAPSAWAGDA
jgi:O-antigen ligase